MRTQIHQNLQKARELLKAVVELLEIALQEWILKSLRGRIA